MIALTYVTDELGFPSLYNRVFHLPSYSCWIANEVQSHKSTRRLWKHENKYENLIRSWSIELKEFLYILVCCSSAILFLIIICKVIFYYIHDVIFFNEFIRKFQNNDYINFWIANLHQLSNYNIYIILIIDVYICIHFLMLILIY